ncbi:glycerol-3-phosphate 1-O-acyltransferase PlsY [Motiliproteus sediminis]|uniref:glycerol-3-phosphate 1-O-acyltransferase PlsY n=1 Tax=Motiliproteus sediminis TaxID=1468178 RepID=UPI001AEF9D54|nr:glycerol-3-phosphate 1-O-acyltransferase PlsY [Motiliproteus sediminis]
MSATVTSTAVALILLAYLLGSVSCAVLACRLYGLPDPRNSGSGNPGATNVFRNGHRAAGTLTLCGDLLKGVLPVAIARALEQPSEVVSLTALAAVLGHLWPVYFGFRGGKGVATTLGVCLAIHPLLGLAQIAIWLVLAKWFRISSLAALLMAILSPPLCLMLAPDYLTLVGILCALMILRHRSNILKLRQGLESRF